MNGEQLKTQLGANIAYYRKQQGMTQAALAEKLNYSDKAVSKWERGESMPDVPTLVQLAELFEVSVDEMLSDPDALPAVTGKVEQVMGMAVEKALKRKANKRSILGLASVLVWFLALLVFVILVLLDVPKSWIGFVYAIPVDAIVCLCLRSAWKDYRSNLLLVSTIMWGCILSLFLSLLLFMPQCPVNIWMLFLLGIPGQIAVFLAFRVKKPLKEEKNGQEGTAQ